jgi:hypothetical protein
MQVTSDLHMLEDEWEALDNVPLNTPSNINKHLQETKVNLLYNKTALTYNSNTKTIFYKN